MRFLVLVIAIVVVVMVGWHFAAGGFRFATGVDQTAASRDKGQVFPPKMTGVFDTAPASGNASDSSASPSAREAERLDDQQQLMEQQQNVREETLAQPYETERRRLDEQAALLEKQKEVLKQQQEIDQMKRNDMAPAPTVHVKPVTDFTP